MRLNRYTEIWTFQYKSDSSVRMHIHARNKFSKPIVRDNKLNE
jgi:hypothetical protein